MSVELTDDWLEWLLEERRVDSDNDIWKRIFTNRTLVLAKEASSLEGTSCLEASRALAEERKGVGHGVERYHLSNLNST